MGKRRRIDVEIGEKPMNRQVCFSKRRQGLFKKASEICMLTGSQIAIITFSPSGKPFVLGHPSLHSVVDRFLQNDDEVNVHATTTSDGDDHHARARLIAQEIEGREILLKKEKDKRQGVGECDVSDLECDYDLWFEIDQESRSDLEKLETLHDEWMQARKKIVEKLGTASSSTSSIMASSSDYNGIVNKGSASASLDDPFAGLCHTPESFHVDPLSEVVDNFLLHNSSHGDDENYWDLDELNLDWDFVF